MTRILLTFLFVFSIQLHIKAQTSIDALALNIPQANTYDAGSIANYIKTNFTTDSTRVRAIYVWITNNIQYDLAQLQSRQTKPNSPPQPVADVLKTRKAVCQGYTDLFLELCKGVGVNAHFIGGYTKKDGAVNNLPHAWAGVQIENNWFLFDPTWGAGYVQNDQFVPAPNNRFYKLAPADMIKDHMPFDPMYQYLNYPVSNKEFIEGLPTVIAGKAAFNYKDSLKQFFLLSPEEKMHSEARRLEANGIRNQLLLDRLNFLKKGTEPFAFNDANTNLKQAVDLFNVYIQHRNQQFAALEDKQLQQTMDSISYYATTSRNLLGKVAPKDEAQKGMVANMYQNLEKFQTRLMKEKEFVTRYLSTDKTARRQLFTSR